MLVVEDLEFINLEKIQLLLRKYVNFRLYECLGFKDRSDCILISESLKN